MKKRLVKKKLNHDILAKLWRKSLHNWMNVIVDINNKGHFKSFNTLLTWREVLSETDLLRHDLAVKMWDYDWNQLVTYSYKKYRIKKKELLNF